MILVLILTFIINQTNIFRFGSVQFGEFVFCVDFYQLAFFFIRKLPKEILITKKQDGLPVHSERIGKELVNHGFDCLQLSPSNPMLFNSFWNNTHFGLN